MKSAEQVIKKLQAEFPGKSIITIPERNPEEIICEIEPTTEHPEYSVAIVYYFGSSIPHYHKKSVETYTVEEGILEVYINGKKKLLDKGESITIQPGTVHYAIGNGVRLRVHSVPGWMPEDHIIVNSTQ